MPLMGFNVFFVFIKHLTLILSLLAGSAIAYSRPEKPNIIFIMLDDLGKEWISCYGAEDINTPNIDALASGGMKFDNAYSMPQCTPSRATLLTGTYPYHNGFVNHWDVPRWGVGYFDWKNKRNTTFATLMKDLGYTTFATGKWQINDFRLAPDAMKKHGFDDWAMWTGYETGVKASAERYQNPYIHTAKGSKTYEGKFGPDAYIDYLIDFMTENKSQPMCLYVPMCLPHTPFVTTPDEPKAKTKLDKHKAMVRYADKMVGRIVDALHKLKLRQRTLIIFTTDNGSTGSITGKRNGVSVRGSKAKEVEAGCNAPFIVNWPVTTPAGVTTDALTDFSDLLPTFVELGGGKVSAELKIDGVSIAPLIMGKAKDSPRTWITALGHGPAMLDDKGVRGKENFATRVIRDKRHKIWVSNQRKVIHLHDLQEDPWEKVNLINSDEPQHKQAMAKLRKVLEDMPKVDARPMYEDRAPNAWDKKLEIYKK